MKTTIRKQDLIKDFENGKCAIRWCSIYGECKAIYLDRTEKTIRFDTYLSLPYANYNSVNPKGHDYLWDYVFFDQKTKDNFKKVYRNIH